MTVSIKVEGLRAHKGHTSNHGPGGSIPLSKIDSNSFLMGYITIFIEGNAASLYGVKRMGEYYADVFIRALVQTTNELKKTEAKDLVLSYHYDQGESLYLFTRVQETLTFSIVEDEGEGERWDFNCSFEDFENALNEELFVIRSLLLQHLGAAGERYYQENIMGAPNA